MSEDEEQQYMRVPKEHAEAVMGKLADAGLIDEEVREVIFNAYEKSKNLIKNNVKTLNNVVDYLIANETIEGEKLNTLLSTS